MLHLPRVIWNASRHVSHKWCHPLQVLASGSFFSSPVPPLCWLLVWPPEYIATWKKIKRHDQEDEINTPPSQTTVSATQLHTSDFQTVVWKSNKNTNKMGHFSSSNIKFICGHVFWTRPSKRQIMKPQKINQQMAIYYRLPQDLQIVLCKRLKFVI